MDKIDMQKLGLAVFEQALRDAAGHHSYYKPHAEWWLEGENEGYDYWCDVLNIDKTKMKKQLKQLEPDDLK